MLGGAATGGESHMRCALVLTLTAAAGYARERRVNPKLSRLPANRWVKVHEQAKGDDVVFMRQAHGGSCFDAKRGVLVLFGSNTHSKDWKNSPFLFDPVRERWSRLYDDDAVKTYSVNDQGIPVAGRSADHPWATHTFGAVVYDAKRDEMVVACYPGHMRPDKWGHAVRHLWDKVKSHPTWVLTLESRAWRALACQPAHFFPNSASYDAHRGVVIGHRAGEIWELGGEPRSWKRTYRGATIPGWGHDNSAYDAKHRKLIVFGSNGNSNDVWVHDPAGRSVRRMPTPGERPPRDQHNPMAFVPDMGKTVVLVDRTKQKDGTDTDSTETWCYDLGADAWTQIESAALPFACGMNYNMEYDPRHRALLLVTGGHGGRKTAVWALKAR